VGSAATPGGPPTHPGIQIDEPNLEKIYMDVVIELVAAAGLSGATALTAMTLLRRSEVNAAKRMASAGLGPAITTEILGFLLISSLAGASGLIIDLLSRIA
jgi:hypothetical protein